MYRPLFQKNIFLKKPSQNRILIFEGISDNICKTRTPSSLIQCWLQGCLLIPGKHWLE